nr:immunoglobulin light chain junction region [Macaca mulatta]MOW28480.1 immunoglobulin light chain junction region [Macaca mulatta]MOW29670.1 immunoglobulin light chain junction region [Macaca mulatta]MOW30385.1 immunoglobulin light chain junction region [Macaca mulatta]
DYYCFSTDSSGNQRVF